MARKAEVDSAIAGAKLSLPTVLTLMRFVLVVPVMACIFIEMPWARVVTMVCFVVASVTDFVDGWLARKQGTVTRLGKFLDPLADKALVNLTFLTLVMLGQVPVWMFAVILMRDFAVDGLRMMAAGSGVTIAAGWLGKIKTATQMLTIVLILANLVVGSEVLRIINTILLYIVVALTVISGVDYLYKGRKLVL